MLEKLPDPLRRSRTPSESSTSSSSSSDEEEELRRAQRAGSANSETSATDRRNPIEANAVIKKSIPAETVNASTDEDDSDYDDIDGSSGKKKRKDSKEVYRTIVLYEIWFYINDTLNFCILVCFISFSLNYRQK